MAKAHGQVNGARARLVNAATGVADAVTTHGRRRVRTVGRTRGAGRGAFGAPWYGEATGGATDQVVIGEKLRR